MRLGILDWGIGGFGTLKHIQNFDRKDIVYLSDAGYTPYGRVDKNELRNRVTNCIEFLKTHGADYVFVACNSGGTVTEETGFSGSIIPFGKKLIHPIEEKVLILGGDRTVNSRIFGMNECFQYQSGQALSALIEKGEKEQAMDILSPLLKDFDGTIVLHACTHYPALSKLIAAEFPELNQLDPAVSAAKFLEQKEINEGGNVFYTTGNCQLSRISAQLAFDVEGINFTKVNVS